MRLVYARPNRGNISHFVRRYRYRPARSGRRLRSQHRVLRRPCPRHLSMALPARDRKWRCRTRAEHRVWYVDGGASARAIMSSDPMTEAIETDVLVIGGGTGGPMAAIRAKEKNP